MNWRKWNIYNNGLLFSYKEFKIRFILLDRPEFGLDNRYSVIPIKRDTEHKKI